jgi:hypothetical protein
MSDPVSRDPSIESPRASFSALPSDTIVVSDTSDEEPPLPARIAAEINAPHPPVSPRTAGQILVQNADNAVVVRDIGLSLRATAERRGAQSTQPLREAQRRAAALQLALLAKEEELRQLQERRGEIEVPEGFQRNDGRVALTCPTSTGALVVPVWIRWAGDGRVEMRAGREAEEPTYVDELILNPDYSRPPAEPLPAWFRDLLYGADGGFHVLAKAARALPDWAAYAEVVRYRREQTTLRHLQYDLEELQAKVDASRTRLDDCRHRMEAAELPNQLRALQGRSALFTGEFTRPQFARRGRGLPNRSSPRQARLPAAGASG